MEEENKSGKMDQSMKVTGKIIWLTDSEDYYTLMEMFMMGNG